MLDALEVELTALRSMAALVAPHGFAVLAPSVLRTELERAELTAAEFSRITGVPREDIESWLTNRNPAPAWVLIPIQLAALLTPSVRRKMLRQPLGKATTPIQKVHPFSRIEDL